MTLDSSFAPLIRIVNDGDIVKRNEVLKRLLKKCHPQHHLITRLNLGVIDHYSKVNDLKGAVFQFSINIFLIL